MAQLKLPEGLSISSGMQRKRVPRRPSHPFYVQSYPFEITPFFIAPVIAGETMKNLLLQSRVVSTPVQNKLIGHWCEHYFFYVKLRDLADREHIEEMLLDMTATNVDTYAADSVPLYAKSGAPHWLKMCLDRIVDEFFRDEGDTGLVGTTTGLPRAYVNRKDWGESMTLDSAIESDTIDGTTTPIDFADLEGKLQTWEFMRQNQLTELSFEDYLATFGVRNTEKEETHKPELVRFIRNWSYPTNTVDGSGNINTQLSWSVAERADKDRFFKEPGFLVGVTLQRPKIYLGSQWQSAVSFLDNAFAWLPATMKEHASTSLKKITTAAANSPHNGTFAAADYWVDVRDLHVHGDQFVNQAMSAARNAVDPAGSTFHAKKYADEADVQAIGAGEPASLTYEQDGIVSLNILGTQVDMT